MDKRELFQYLPLVRRPSRYIDTEVNSQKKDPSKVKLLFGLAFPDAYEVGMSHLGLQILYQILNSDERIACERIFAPWADMEALLRERGLPLTTLESAIPLARLDILGFSLQYELAYTNVLAMLDLGGIPLFSGDRREDHPIVIGGGPVTFNPEPVAAFFDAFLLGDGEEAALEIARAVMEAKAAGMKRADLLRRLSEIRGVYVPSFYTVSCREDGTVEEIKPLDGAPPRVTRRILPDIDSAPLPVRPIVPFTAAVHDRLTVEISRGCTRGCRFCQAGMIYRPVRERSPERIREIIREGLKNTGYDEVSLLSLSAGDYTCIGPLLESLMAELTAERVALSLPSMRVGTLTGRLAGEIKRVRKTGFTLAPEAGTERLRDVINKRIKEEDLLRAAEEIFSLGWRSIKLYFMIGLPTETDDDVRAIVALAKAVKRAGRGRHGVTVSVSTFIPRPVTPFQWEPQISIEECLRLQYLLRKETRAAGLDFKWHDSGMSWLEGVFARGDRRLSSVILNAYRKGARFDGWGECFNFDLWREAFAEEGLDMDFYTVRRRLPEEVFPWEHLDSGVKKDFLRKELERALSLSFTPDCKTSRCTDCGVCDFRTVKNIVAPAPCEEASPVAVPERKGPALRLRLSYSKTGRMRFLGHLELTTALKRAIRRAGLPVVYSEGFHPHPRLSFSEPLPVGVESLDEYIDMELTGPVKPEEAASRLNRVAPEGIKFMPSLNMDLPSVKMSGEVYLVFLENGPQGLNIDTKRIDGFIRDLRRRKFYPAEIERGKKKKRVDLKQAIEEISLVDAGTLRVAIRKDPVPIVRPADVLACVSGLSHRDASLIPILKTKTLFGRA